MVCFPGVSQGVVSSFRNCIHTNTSPRSSCSESPGRYSLRWKFANESVESIAFLGVHYVMSYTSRNDELALRDPGQVSISNSGPKRGVGDLSDSVRANTNQPLSSNRVTITGSSTAQHATIYALTPNAP